MNSIMVRHVDGMFAGDVSVLAMDITAFEDAWGIVENIATSYDRNGIDRRAMVFWFQNAAGLHHIWVEQAKANVRAVSLSERVAFLLFNGSAPSSIIAREAQQLRKAA